MLLDVVLHCREGFASLCLKNVIVVSRSLRKSSDSNDNPYLALIVVDFTVKELIFAANYLACLETDGSPQ